MASAVSSGLFGTSTAMLAVKATTLPRSLLKFPPSSIPTTLPPPGELPTLAHPFTIPTNIYNALLSPTVPITFALVYTSVVSYFNNVNAQRKHKPWPSSQTSAFKGFVLIHNVVLAAYSAWTFVGMTNALVLSFASWRGEDGLAGVVDSLCKMNGPRGLGSAATYNETSSAWQITNRAFHLAADGLGPESTDVGRMWNEGLAFYGWLFYLSKFYEVIDTAIILAKGKRSSFLQAYHHAGAMLCMWAGIRYMSPPIWMFVFVNSGIHAIMYTFYFCTAMGVRIPKRVKQILTTMQISQFVIGALYAFAHLFVAYRIPVSVPYIYHLGSAVSSAVSAAGSDASSVASSAIATASAGAWLKKLALRAAGREALAENVPNDRGQKFGIDAVNIFQDLTSREETRYRDELQWTHCLDTSGQVFAILLNCMYLAPLTWLFVRFFITAYSKRIERRRSATPSDKAQVAGQGLQDASKGLARQVSDVLDQMHGVGGDDSEAASPLEGEQVNGNSIKKTAEDVKNAVQSRIGEGVEKAKQIKDQLGGGIDPVAYLQNKSTEPWQRKSTTPSDVAEKPDTDLAKHEEQRQGEGASEEAAKDDEKANDGPSDKIEDKGVETDQDASEETPAAKSSSEESGKEEGVAPSPNDNGTAVEGASGASSTTDRQQETTDEDDEEGKAKENEQEEEKSGDNGQATASTEEPEQEVSERDSPAKDTEPESQRQDPAGQEVLDTPTSDDQDQSRKPSDIEPATPDQEQNAGHGEAGIVESHEDSKTEHDASEPDENADELGASNSKKSVEQAQDGSGDEGDYEHAEKPGDESHDGHESKPHDTVAEEPAQEPAEHPAEESVDDSGKNIDATAEVSAREAEDGPKDQAEENTGQEKTAQKSKEGAEDTQAEKAPKLGDGASKEDPASAAQDEGDAGEHSGDEAEQISFIEPEKALAELPKVQPEDAPGAAGEATEATPTEESESKPAAQSEEQEKPSTPSPQKDQTAEAEKPSVSGGGKADEAEDPAETLAHVPSKSPSTKSRTSSIRSKASSIRSKASSLKSRAASLKSKSSQSLNSKHEAGKNKEKEGSGKVSDKTSFAGAVKE